MSKAKRPERTPRELELDDTLSDLLNGLRVWRDGKIHRGDWTDEDEMLMRWIEAGPAEL